MDTSNEAPQVVNETAAKDEPQQPLYMRLSAEELIEKNLLPVKKEFIRLRKANGPSSAPAPRQPSKAAQKKAQKRKVNMCNAFLTGNCTFANCKYSHDFAAFVAEKQPDLPGLCPFEARSDEPCPFGVSCRWAIKHRASPPEFAQAVQQKEKDSEAGVSASAEEAPAPLTVCGDLVLIPEDGSIPPEDKRPLELYSGPSADRVSVASIRAEQNDCKDAKEALQRSRYDLSKSFNYLKSLGIQVKNPKAAKAAKAQNRNAEREAKLQAEKEAAEKAAQAAAAGEEEDGGEEAAAKKIKTEEGAVPVAAAAPDLVQGEKGSISVKPAAAEEYKETPLRPAEKKQIDFKGKTYLAPLTTNGNLPFRRLAVQLGCDITCSEMAMATNILQGHRPEFALLKRHPSEKIFGVQVCGGFADAMGQCAQVLSESVECDFVDINSGCPIDLVCHKGGGSSLLRTPNKVENICRAMSGMLDCPLTLKVRKGYELNNDTVHTWLPRVNEWGVAAVTVHGRTREQRYSKLADWEYIEKCASVTKVPLIGNGDIFSFEEYNEHMASGHLSTVMIGRGALIKPWLFTEIKEQRHWDISATERLDIFKDFCRFGLDHWGSDDKGVETTRRFLLEMMSFTHRYIPVGLLDSLPYQRMNLRPPTIYGRNQLETWLASESGDDWLKLSELLLGPAPEGFVFAPKHRSNSYSVNDSDLAKLAGPVADDGEENG